MIETFLAPAKLNLYLKVVGKRNDGYHFIESIMQTVSLFDVIEMELISGNDILITCDDDNIPCDESNIAYKCALEFLRHVGIKRGIKVNIKKNIPYGAGLGGGSSDGAAVIYGLNKMLSLNLSLNELAEIGGKVGADIPFLLFGGTAKVTGIGDNIERISEIKDCFFIVIKPNVYISTKEAYKKIDNEKLSKAGNLTDILTSMKNKNIFKIAKFLENDFELVAPKEIFEIKKELKNKGAINSLMTGSGSAVFGIFRNKEEAVKAMEELKVLYDKIYLVRSIEKW